MKMNKVQKTLMSICIIVMLAITCGLVYGMNYGYIMPELCIGFAIMLGGWGFSVHKLIMGDFDDPEDKWLWIGNIAIIVSATVAIGLISLGLFD